MRHGREEDVVGLGNRAVYGMFDDSADRHFIEPETGHGISLSRVAQSLRNIRFSDHRKPSPGRFSVVGPEGFEPPT